MSLPSLPFSPLNPNPDNTPASPQRGLVKPPSTKGFSYFGSSVDGYAFATSVTLTLTNVPAGATILLFGVNTTYSKATDNGNPMSFLGQNIANTQAVFKTNNVSGGSHKIIITATTTANIYCTAVWYAAGDVCALPTFVARSFLTGANGQIAIPVLPTTNNATVVSWCFNTYNTPPAAVYPGNLLQWVGNQSSTAALNGYSACTEDYYLPASALITPTFGCTGASTTVITTLALGPPGYTAPVPLNAPVISPATHPAVGRQGIPGSWLFGQRQQQDTTVSTSGPTTINLDVGAWAWSGTPVGIPVNIATTPGAWNWAGVPVTINELVNLSPGAWTWAGVPVTTNELVNLSPGAWSWAGVPVTTTQLTNLSPGAWTWAGLPVTSTQLFNLNPGTWTWQGLAVTLNQLYNLDTGAWTWQGLPVTFGGALPTINLGVGAWGWAGLPITTTQLVNTNIGTWTWSGVSVGFTQLFNLDKGAWTWAGTNTTFSSLFSLDIGSWNWAGVNVTIINGIPTVNLNVGAWTWQGEPVTFGSQAPVHGGHGSEPDYRRKKKPQLIRTYAEQARLEWLVAEKDKEKRQNERRMQQEARDMDEIKMIISFLDKLEDE